MAEKEGVIYELTWHIILEVLKDYKIVSAVSSGIKFSLNISPGLFKIPRFANELLQLFEDFNIPTSQFILEITEAMESDQIPEFLRSLTRLRVKGFELSLDDFGTGNSNTLKLLYLPITELKLDQKFISRVVNNEQAEKLVKSTLELAKTYEVETTAEGIEDANTLFWLKENGCDLAQGYLISKAMDRVSLVNFIERNELDTIIDKIYQKDSPAN